MHGSDTASLRSRASKNWQPSQPRPQAVLHGPNVSWPMPQTSSGVQTPSRTRHRAPVQHSWSTAPIRAFPPLLTRNKAQCERTGLKPPAIGTKLKQTSPSLDELLWRHGPRLDAERLRVTPTGSTRSSWKVLTTLNSFSEHNAAHGPYELDSMP